MFWNNSWADEVDAPVWNKVKCPDCEWKGYVVEKTFEERQILFRRF
jgi:hypothetical protein